MIKKISIKNYKSIVDDEIELGRVNVFIGANGAGKSNILEAVAMFSAAKGFDLSVEDLENRGIRITKPNLMFNSFIGKKTNDSIKLELTAYKKNMEEFAPDLYKVELLPSDSGDIFSNWSDVAIKKLLAKKMSEDVVFPNNPRKEKVLRESFDKLYDEFASSNKTDTFLSEVRTFDFYGKLMNFQIYTLNTPALRGITKDSRKRPLGLNGENLDILLSSFDEKEWQLLRDYSHFISWLEDVFVDEQDRLKFEGHRLGRSTSRLYFVDQFMRKNNNIFAAENANEGALYVLFYLALFISKKTPSFFAIDNIETALNPKICRALMKAISELAEITGKQVLITTHNPAVLDGINLTEQRLFVVNRTDEGHTKTKRIEFKPQNGQSKYKLSELWMRGKLGGLPQNFL